MRVNDRIVYNEEPGVVTEVHDGRYEGYVDLRMDNGDIHQMVDTCHVIVVSEVPLALDYGFQKGDRVSDDDGRIYRVAKQVNIDDRPHYMCEPGAKLLAQYDIRMAPLPHVTDNDLEELMADYFTRKMTTMLNDCRTAKYDDVNRLVFGVDVVSSRSDESSVTWNARMNYGEIGVTGSALDDTLMELMHRIEFAHRNKPKSLPRR